MIRVKCPIFSAVLLAICGVAALDNAVFAKEVPPPAPAVTEFTGVLKTGIVAAGGETTGVQITLDDKSVHELDLGNDKDLIAAAGKLDGKRVYVQGVSYTKAGVEGPDRVILKVKLLHADDSTPAPAPPAPKPPM